MKINDTTLHKYVCFDLNEINNALEKALKRYRHNTYDSNILTIIALYDDREKFSIIRGKVNRLKIRIESGRETPIMKKILMKTMRSKVNFVEDTQEIKTMTPPSSSTEDESDSDMSLLSNFSSKPRSSNGRSVRTQKERFSFFSKPRSSHGRSVRTEQEHFFSFSKPRSSNGRSVRTQKEHFSFSKPRSSNGRSVRTQQEHFFLFQSPGARTGGVSALKKSIFLFQSLVARTDGLSALNKSIFLLF